MKKQEKNSNLKQGESQMKTKGIQDWFRKDEKYIPENHWLRRHGYRKDGRVFNRFLSGHEADYISCMHKEIAGHRQDIINMKKIKIDDIKTYFSVSNYVTPRRV